MFVEFVSSAKCVLFRSKKNQVTTANILLLLFPSLLHHFFNSNSVSFVERGRKNISCPRAQGTLATPLAMHQSSYGLLVFSYELMTSNMGEGCIRAVRNVQISYDGFLSNFRPSPHMTVF